MGEKLQINNFNLSTNDADTAEVFVKFAAEVMDSGKGAFINFVNQEEILELARRKKNGPLTRKRYSETEQKKAQSQNEAKSFVERIHQQLKEQKKAHSAATGKDHEPQKSQKAPTPSSANQTSYVPVQAVPPPQIVEDQQLIQQTIQQQQNQLMQQQVPPQIMPLQPQNQMVHQQQAQIMQQPPHNFQPQATPYYGGEYLTSTTMDISR
uniref:Uncharacterized protein n=1 Tax=Panagrolaimus sp. ES5 TaxID=591445 RepID=A0AC34FGW6_9BILA